MDDLLWHIVGADAESRGDTGPEALDDDVRASAERPRERRVPLEVADDRLLAAPERLVPAGRGHAHRVTLRRLDSDDARAEAEELAARVGRREVPAEVDDDRPVEWSLRCVGHRAYSDRRLTERSIAASDRQGGAEEKRRQILDAAVRVFARRGFHTSRVGDIAEEAGIAHGLLYHYFSSKDEVLQTVFRENWSELLQRFEQVEASDEPPTKSFAGSSRSSSVPGGTTPTWSRSWSARSAAAPLSRQVEVIGKGFAVIERVIEQGQAEGVFRPELDPRLASWVVYGALEEILTGWVMGRLPDGDEEVARAERTIVDVVLGGLGKTPVVA